jgi:HEAT repeat protein
MGKEAEEVVPQLIEMLKDESAYVQMQAAETLGEIAEKAEAAVPALIEALKPRTEGSVTYFGVPQFAAKALGKIGEKAAPAVPALIEALKVQAVRSEAAKALMKIEAKGQGPSPTVIEAVVKSFKSQESWAQPDLFKDLAAVGENAGPVLISLMKDADDLISWKASRALETSSPEVISLLPQEMITGGLTQSHELQMRLIVKGLIEKFGGVAVLDVLLRDFSSGDIVYQRSVLYLMGLGGFELSAAGDAEMRQRYGNFKPRLFPNLNRVRGVLEEGLQNPDLRLNAIWALGEMGGLSAWAIPSMVRIYRNSRFHYEKIRVIEAWGKMGRSAQGVRDLLLRETRLAGWDPLRFAAVRSLGQIAQANDAEVIDVLTQIASQPRSESLAGAAAEALDFIQSQMTTP